MRKFGLVLALLALMALPALAQSDFNIMGNGARARGMGGAFIGVADDATAVGWNPAGIAQLDKMEASAVGIFSNMKYNSEFSSPYYSDSYDESVSHIAPAFASLIIPTKVAEKNLVFAVAYQRLIDLAYNYSESDAVSEYTYKVTGGIDAITPAFAFQVTPNFSIGAAGNILILGSKMEDGTTYTNGDFEIVEDEVRYSGFDMNLGGLITMPKVNIGIACRLPFDLKDEGDWTYSESFSGVAYDTTGKYLETSYNFPLMLGFGIAFKPTDKLTLAGDFEMRKYSDTEREWTDNGIDYTQDQNWEDCNQFRIGMEYVFVGPNTVFPVRLGFRTDPKTFNGYTGTFTAPDSAQVVGKVITGGFGMKFGNIWFDLAAEYGTATYNDQEESDVSSVSKGSDLNILASCVVHF